MTWQCWELGPLYQIIRLLFNLSHLYRSMYFQVCSTVLEVVLSDLFQVSEYHLFDSGLNYGPIKKWKVQKFKVILTT